MRTKHHVFVAVDPERAKTFSRFGIQLTGRFDSFDIFDEDANWPEVANLIERYKLTKMSYTTFTKGELNQANYLDIGASGHTGYPMPDDDFGYQSITYDSSNVCNKCWNGVVQIAPFRFRNAPSWGSKSIMQLNWVYDQFFVKPETWEEVFQPFGIGCKEVIHHRRKIVLDEVVQLDISTLVDLKMDDNEYRFEICPECGKKRYHPGLYGYYPEPAATDAAMFKSTQVFGSGGSSFRRVMISRALYKKLLEVKFKGLYFHPCRYSGLTANTSDHVPIEDDHSEMNSRLCDLANKWMDSVLLADYYQLSARAQVFKCVWTLEGELNNGGFDQYFFNSAGDLAAHTIIALRAIGADGAASIVERAIKVLGQASIPGRVDRQNALLGLSASKNEKLEQLSEEYLGYSDDLTLLLYRYISAHRAELNVPAGF